MLPKRLDNRGAHRSSDQLDSFGLSLRSAGIPVSPFLVNKMIYPNERFLQVHDRRRAMPAVSEGERFLNPDESWFPSEVQREIQIFSIHIRAVASPRAFALN